MNDLAVEVQNKEFFSEDIDRNITKKETGKTSEIVQWRPITCQAAC